MAQVQWHGNAVTRAQSGTVAITGADSSSTYKLTSTDERAETFEVSYQEAGSPTTSTIATGLAAAWNKAENEAVARVAATVSTATITLTAKTAGVPFTVASSKAGGSGTIGSYTAVNTNAGPEDWNTAENWSGGAVPSANDEVLIPTGTSAILYGLDQNSASFESFRVQEHLLQIGGTDGGFLKFSVDSTGEFEFCKPEGQAWIDIQATSVPPVIKGTASPGIGEHGLYLKGTAVANLYLFKGNVGFGTEGDDGTSKCSNFWVGHQGAATEDVYLRIGKVVLSTGSSTITLIDKDGGTVVCEAEAGVATVNQRAGGGRFDIEGKGPIGTAITVEGGEARLNSSGTVASLVCEGGTTTTMFSNKARTITTLKMNPRNGEAVFAWNKSVVTLTNKITTDDDKVVFQARTSGT